MEHELAYIGIGVSIFGVILSYLIFRRVNKIESKRRTDQKSHFKKLVIDNIEEVFQIYQSASTLSHRTKLTEGELEEITKELHQFFKKNNENILRLIRDTKFYASMLSVIDSPSVDMNEVIEKIRWLTNSFYILDYPVERNMNRWCTQEQELQNNKDFIEKTLTSLHKI